MAMVIPRSLNAPVGLAPSTFNHTCAPTRADRLGAGRRGVPPSSSVTTAASGPSGRNSRYSSTIPRQPSTSALVLGSDHPEHPAHAVDHVEAAQVFDGPGHGAAAR